MDIEYTLTGTLSVPEGSSVDGSFVTLPSGERITLDLMMMRDVTGGGVLVPLDDEDAHPLGCQVQTDNIQTSEEPQLWPPCGGHLMRMTASPHMILFLSTPGHGYYAVPHTLIQQSGVTGISTCSYTNGEVAYLEEDCDGPRFLKAAEAQGLDLNVREKVVQDDRFIHRLRPYA